MKEFAPQRDIDFRAFVTESPDLHCVAGLDGTFQWLSDAWTGALGWSQDELKSRPFFEFVHPDDVEATAAELEGLARGRSVLRFSNRYRHKAGGHRWLAWVARPQPDGRIYAIARDETELKSALADAARQLELLQVAERMSGCGHWRVVLGQDEIYWSPQVYRLHGRNPDTYRPTLDEGISAYHPDDRPLVAAHLEASIRTKSAFDFRLRLMRGEDVREVQVRGHPELDAAGEVVAVIGIFQDVTERKPGTVLSWLTDTDRQCTYLSQGWYDYTGQDPTMALGLSWLDVVHPSDLPSVKEQFFAAHDAELPFDFEYRLRNPHGTYRWFMVSASPTVDDAGEFNGYLGTSLDIDDRKRLEEERAGLLEREQAAREQAERASRLKDQFLSTVSHELRTPLSAVLGWAQMLRGGTLDDEAVQRGLAVIERNARAQSQIIEDILDVSGILAGKLSLEVEPISVAEVVAGAVETVRPSANARRIQLAATLETAATVMGDAARLHQVVTNLLSNAIKFTDKGGRVRVVVTKARSMVELRVEDNGRGIEPESLSTIFDRFWQVERGSRRREGGLGLGLSIVKHLVEAHGGDVSAHSDGLDKGAAFCVRIPVAATFDLSEPDHSDARPSNHDGFAHVPEELDGARILVVDDEADVRELLKAMLRECGAQVDTAASADDALAKMAAAPPEILVSDIGMPGRSGFDLIAAVRAEPWGAASRLPAVAVTAFARGSDRAQVLRAGFQSHVPKPVEPAELFAVLAALLPR